LNLVDFNEITWSTNGGHRILEEYLVYERKHWFVSEFMTKVDGATMHYGLEARSPFLDHCLWEFVSSLPFGLRLRGGRLKAILRELVKRKIGWAVANRRKKGFGVPVQRWIVERWRPLVESALRDSVLEKEGWINSQAVLTQLALATKNGWAPEHLWYLFILELWMKYERFGTTCLDQNQRIMEGKFQE
jgi:asparagine synthase (glutamine-hydrolysing)